jgi:4-hydroxy-tetrahydrodipicolinate synthase
MGASIQGAYAAVLTPRKETGEIDESAFRRLLEFLLGKGIAGFAINGATGEFGITSEQEFERLMAAAAQTLKGRATFLAGIGSGSSITSIHLGNIASSAGAAGLLLPMPCFFPYSQDDLKAFSCGVAKEADAPVLLYNLPQFTSGLNPQTSLELIRESEAIVGIKDSSGSLDTLRMLTDAAIGARRIVGNDEVLAQALKENLLDGVVSGVACVLPELIGRIYSVGMVDSGSLEFGELAAALTAAIDELRPLPTPWGLKMIAESRGLLKATYPMPLSPERETQKTALLRWFEQNRARLLAQ